MNITKKNGRIELLRFLFALIILLFHIQKRFATSPVPMGDTGLYFFNHGCIGVEFFFLVSGYLLAAGCYKLRDEPCDFIGTETAGVMWKKIKHIFPYHIYAMIFTVTINAYFLCHTANKRLMYVINSWASVLFLQVFGFQSTWVNKLTWSIDVWLMVTFIFYIFARKYYDVFVKIVCPALALFILGYLDHEYGALSGINVWTGHFYKAFLRGLAEMALGCSAYSLTRRINHEKFNTSGKAVCAIIEAAGYIIIIIYSCTKYAGRYEFPILFLMWGVMTLTFSDVNPLHKIFDKPIFPYLGKLSLLIYLNQFYVIRLVQELFSEGTFVQKTLLASIGTIIASLVCDFIINLYQKYRPIHTLMYGKNGDGAI